ncbi:hypothetical protein EON68_02550 [archaeon]|nr:MAG: hypothetical protein EON68_02550 [archaeon]
MTSVFATARAQEAGAPVQEEEEEEELEEIIVDATGEARTEEVEVDAAGSAGAPGQAAEEVTPEQLEAVRDDCPCTATSRARERALNTRTQATRHCVPHRPARPRAATAFFQ